MTPRFKSLTRALALAGAVALPSMAMAQQPLFISVPSAIISAPFSVFSPAPANVYNPAPAAAAAVSYTPDYLGVVPAPVLLQTGPRYENPANADYSHPTIIRVGSFVPGYVKTAPAENISVSGLVPEGRYEFFVSPEQKIVFLDPASRQVVKILR